MAPLQKAPAGENGDPDTQTEKDTATQAGRSSSSLAAERNSAELRSQASTPLDRQESSNSSTLLGSSSNSQLDIRSSISNPNKRALHAPIVPSPLNPSSASSRSSTSSSEEQTGADGTLFPVPSRPSGDRLRTLSTGSIQAGGSMKPKGNIALNPAQARLKYHFTPIIRPRSFPRPETPKLIKDLGRDYSRYPLSSPYCYSDPRPPGRLSQAGSRASLLRTTTNNPFSDSEADLDKWGYPDDSIGAFNPYHGGEKGFILYNDELEDDDKYHMPQDDDDITFRPNWREYFAPRSLVSAIGGIFLVLGLVSMLIILPILTFSTNVYMQGEKKAGGNYWTGPAWAHVNNNTYPLLKNVRTGLIDPDTPSSAKTRTSTFDGSQLELVFSDEFNDDNRTFYPGDDPFWTAANLWYGATQDFEWYDPDAVTTGGGTLQLKLDQFANHNLDYRSGMLNSWNQLCFKGGVFEVSASLAGPAGVPGLWPGAWTMGNLGRPGYKASTEGLWPYTYNSCDLGITPNQSSPDGLSQLPGQKLPSCTCQGADHPSPGTGRGAPEIDIFEGSVDPNNRIGVVTQSFQVAPFDVYYRPNNDFMAMPNYNTTQMNGYCGGPFQQAISATTLLNNGWYDGQAYQKYAFEYIPGTSTGKIAWFVGEDLSFIMDGRAIGRNGNVAARQVSEEPMSMVLNLGFSSAWTEIQQADLKFPTTMHVDYVRLYQKPGETILTCDPPGYPTTEYIANHPIAYRNPNMTAWADTGYAWPKNKLMGC